MYSKDLRNVGFVAPFFYEYSRSTRNGVLDWMDQHGDHWRLIEMDPSEWRASPALWKELDGLIIWYWGPWELRKTVKRWGLPAIELGLFEAGGRPAVVGDTRISFDRHSINRLAVRHFVELGMECVGYVGKSLRIGRRRGPRVEDMRKEALRAGLEWVEFDLGERHPVIDPSVLLHGSRLPGLRKFLEGLVPGTGLLAQDDYLGVMLCEAALQLGIAIPGDLAVLGQGDRTIGRAGACSLSTIQLPGRTIGWEAAAALDGWMSGRRPESRLVPCEDILVRESTGGRSGDIGIERAKRHFDRHVLSGVTVGELASIAGCTPPTLRRRFHEAYGLDVSLAGRARRAEEALRLLRESDLGIHDIGVRCGFPSATNFFNFIRRHAAMGPAEYRRRHGTSSV